MTSADDAVARRRRRRAVLRAHHPDLGGDADELLRRLREIDDRSSGHGDVVFVRRPRGPLRVVAWVRSRRRPRRPRRSRVR